MLVAEEKRGLDREKNLPQEAYLVDNYFTYGQLWSQIDQVNHIRSFEPKKIVEIGVGNGFVSTFLRTMGLQVKTFDINPNLKPDVLAPVEKIADYVQPDEFDLISCCEVLEHLPFGAFEEVIANFSHLSDRLFLTLPVHGRKFGFGGYIRLPKFSRWIGLWLRLPSRDIPLSEMHFWEVDFDQKSRKEEILKILRKYYRHVDSGLFMANPYHRFFKCRGALQRGK